LKACKSGTNNRPRHSSRSTSAPVEGAVVAAASGEFKLDESAPTTSVQIRLADGKRVKATFNLSHTVQDIHLYLQQ
jgi:UBX domain-containing protein 1